MSGNSPGTSGVLKRRPSATKNPSHAESVLDAVAAPPEAWDRKRLLTLWAGAGVLAVAFVWSYWTTLGWLVDSWNRDPDYSHGFLVAPFAAYLLWARRRQFPGWSDHRLWPGLLLIGGSIAVRLFGARFHIQSIDGCSIPLWVAGAVWLLGGWRVLWWSLPSVAFLWFMVPLAWRFERMLSYPLQSIATRLSTWSLQCLGQPALWEGHTIFLGSHQLEVENACSGLRIFVGILALCLAYMALVPQKWWERVLLFLGTIPVALGVNAIRIIITGLLYQYVSGEAGKKFSHDFAGWLMILLAAGFFGLLVYYLKKLFRDEEMLDVREVLRQRHVQA